MSHRFQVLISPDLDAQIEKVARRSRVSKSEWVRRALKESLLREGSETKTNPVERMAALACPISEIYSILEEIDEGRR
jgi:Arc/MetJ-type ribon-helix-helix transcriptional regulator